MERTPGVQRTKAVTSIGTVVSPSIYNIYNWRALPSRIPTADGDKRGTGACGASEDRRPGSSSGLPVVMTTPARTFRRAWGEVKLSVSSLNLSTTRRETASARTCKHSTHTHAQTHTEASVRYVNLWSVWCYLPQERRVAVTVFSLALQTRAWSGEKTPNGNKWARLSAPRGNSSTLFQPFCLNLTWQF